MNPPQNQPEPIQASPVQQAAPHYTQVNILFEATEVELPDAEKFNGYPPEAQTALLVGFRTEQLQRHGWLSKQQDNDFRLNFRSIQQDFWMRLCGLFCALILALVFLRSGAQLILHGASAIGVVMLVGAISGLVGTAIYGHKALNAPQPGPPATPKPE